MNNSLRRTVGAVFVCILCIAAVLVVGPFKRSIPSAAMPPAVNSPPAKSESSRVPSVSSVVVVGKPEGINKKLGSIRYLDADGAEQVVGPISWPNDISANVASGNDVEVEARLEIRESSIHGRYASNYLIQRWRVKSSSDLDFGPWQHPPKKTDKVPQLPAY